MFLAAVTALARAVPLRVGYGLADLFSKGHRALFRERREAVEGNLRVIRGGEGDLESLGRSVFRNYGRFLFELLRGPDVPGLIYDFRDWERLEAALGRGRGVVLAILHTGNWGIAGARMARVGVPVHAVAGVQLRPAWNREIRRRQAAAGIRILEGDAASVREMPRVLARNEVLVLLVDGDVFRRGVPVTICGRSVSFPAGPARLAARTGAALLPAFGLRHDDGSLSGRFLEEIPVDGTEPDAVRRTTALLASRFERVLRDHPDQWMIFRRFFEPAAEVRD